MDILDHFQNVRNANERRKREQDESIRAVIDEAQKALGNAGLNNSPDSLDSRLFWELSRTVAVGKDGVPIPLQDQITEVINELKTYKNQTLETYRASGAVEGEPATPTTLDSVVSAVTESRRI